ncbi:glycerophosphodiester phosphodiesterase family protein [Rathayibacter tanaceti]|uniref:glycerophosphodiester phosphodiesterase n=2 Tax=Rathayibacter tanaceti TaxID=1671680 RepID=A0A166IBX0_9MICO|nr:glycerophosphodiester phosphodiesterase family protein [Rathayibacter tanaceti]KZX22116.1 Glycerophosphoryl diester phosphodiesterase precursor [Rathayibacter tanaceti]QHC56231.1 glycerophosphodiester phosphodiesterase [Rathayibacter tanaceti]TCO37080.1 glycerophosphoryl diester phosphodiesterase [Rathayibacter tanaceti]
MVARPSPLVFAHRGASGYRPEHTRSAYELAIALGADAVEPDLVATRDGVLVLRHENEISGTTDVERRPEFAQRRTTKRIDGREITGWFTEDFTWDELSVLRARERLPAVRTSSATFDGQFPLLRFSELLALLDRAAEDAPEAPPGLVAEIKHATYFAAIGLPLDVLLRHELSAAGWGPRDPRLTIESFEKTVLERLAVRGVGARRVFLLESRGAPPDLVAAHGEYATPFTAFATASGLRNLAGAVDGISVDRSMLLSHDTGDRAAGVSPLVADAHAVGLEVYCWTLRAENRFLGKAHRRGKDPAAYGAWQDEFAAILGTGVDGVFADQPDLALEARAVAEGRSGG